ncbi:MAG: ATP-binding protein [Spiroplasma sp.]
MSEKIKLDIQPPTSIYSTYQRLTYTIWHAIAEFVDNSTASYELNKSILKKIPGYKLTIYIIYQNALKAKDCILTIIDNAYGMEKEEFKRAIILNSPPKDKSGRNEFGMGLKTAACWFGNEWEITSTQLGSNKLYSTIMDIDYLAITNEKNINVNIERVDSSDHYTKLIIRKLNRKITPSKRKKVINQISSIYRKDLRENEIEIKYIEQSYNENHNLQYSNDGENFFNSINETPSLEYKLPKIWEYFDEESGTKKPYFKKFSEEIIFEDEKYFINGFVAIREIGSRSEAGLTLIRRNRVIIGGTDSNYRPKEIFGDASSYAWLRVFGEVNMNNWPVTQAKNAFDWDNGLEEVFINKMTGIAKDLVIKNEKLRKEEKINQDLTHILEIKKNNFAIEQMFKNPIGNLTIEKLKDFEDNNKQEDFSNTASKKLSNYLIFKLNDGTNKEIYINYEADLSRKPTDWLKINFIENIKNIVKFKVTIFYEHPFFKPYINDGEFILVLKKFAIALAVSVINAEFSTIQVFNGFEILEFMNEYLKQVINEVK